MDKYFYKESKIHLTLHREFDRLDIGINPEELYSTKGGPKMAKTKDKRETKTNKPKLTVKEKKEKKKEKEAAKS
jgi:hypothetical protein